MKKEQRLLIISRDAEKYSQLIKALDFSDLVIDAVESTDKAADYVEHCTIMLGEPKRIAPMLNRAVNLVWAQSTYAGVEPLVTPESRTDYTLTGVKNVFGPFMSEYVFSYIVAFERHAFDLYRNQQKRIWQKIPYRSIKKRLIGICGLGSIGKHLAQTANHFGLRVWGYKKELENIQGVERVFTESDFREFLAGPDYIVIILPSTPATYHLFDQEAIASMKSSAVLINIGRGNIGLITNSSKTFIRKVLVFILKDVQYWNNRFLIQLSLLKKLLLQLHGSIKFELIQAQLELLVKHRTLN
jgi:phosphoglycerate dehydrogenase-like enzyme